MSVYDLLESNKFDLFTGSATINKVKISNITDNNNYVQQLQNKNGTIALISNIVDSLSYYASLTSNIPTNYSFTSTTTYQLMFFLDNSNVVQNVSNFITIGSGSFCSGLQYIGTTQQVFRIIFSSSIKGSNNSILTLNLYKNNVPTTCFCKCTSYSDPNIFYLDIILLLSPNDQLQIYHKSDISQSISPLSPSFQIFVV